MAHRLAHLVLLAVVAASCSTGDGSRAATRTESVGPISLEVPRGWRDADEPAAAGMVAQRAWSPAPDDATTLQVVVGCGDEGADQLAIAAMRADRTPLVVTAADDLVSVEVAGLDAARRITLTLGGGRPDDRETLRLAGLYGSGDDVLVLVELSSPVASHDDVLADRILGSVVADRGALAEACASD